MDEVTTAHLVLAGILDPAKEIQKLEKDKVGADSYIRLYSNALAG